MMLKSTIGQNGMPYKKNIDWGEPERAPHYSVTELQDACVRYVRYV